MKRIIALLLITLFLVVMAACDDDEPVGSDQSGSTGITDADIEKLEGELKYQYNMQDYIILPEYSGGKVEVLLDDIQKQIDSFILNYANKTDRTICMIGDVVDVSYIVYELDENDKILKKDGKPVIIDERESFGFYLGSRLSHAELEDGIIGMSVGEQCDIYLTMPKDYFNSQLATKRVLFDVQVNSIFDAPLYNDAFVSENFDSYKTIEELEHSMLAERVYDYISNNSTIKKYPEKEYSALVNELEAMEESFEKEKGISLDEYIRNTYDMTREEYIKSEMKSTMLVYALVQKESTSITDAELINEKKELVSYYTSYYKSKGMGQNEAAKNALEMVNDLGISYLYEMVASKKLDSLLLDTVEIEKKAATYKSITVSLLERANGKSGNQVGDICPSFNAEVFDENGSLSTTLNPSRNVGKVTIIFFWNNTDEKSIQALNKLNQLANEQGNLTVYAIHSTENYGSAPDFLTQNMIDSKIIFLKDYKESANSEEALFQMLGMSYDNPCMLIINEDGVIKERVSQSIGYDELLDAVKKLSK